MKKIKYPKAMIYEEHGKGCIVLVKSRDPNTKIQILKDKIKKNSKSKSSKQSEGMGLFGW